MEAFSQETLDQSGTKREQTRSSVCNANGRDCSDGRMSCRTEQGLQLQSSLMTFLT